MMIEKNAGTARAATLHLVCGKMASGKSTLAMELSKQHEAVLLSEDSMLEILYPGEISDVLSYSERAGRLKSALEGVVTALLANGTSVVMDFPANTTSQRSWLVNLSKAANAHHTLHYLDRTDATCKAQLQKRARENPERATTDTIEMFEAITRYFDPPSDREGINIKKVSD